MVIHRSLFSLTDRVGDAKELSAYGLLPPDLIPSLLLPLHFFLVALWRVRSVEECMFISGMNGGSGGAPWMSMYRALR